MTNVAIEIAVVDEDDRAQSSRAESVSPWLRGRKLDEEDSAASVSGTVSRRGPSEDYLVKFPTSPKSKVASFTAEQRFEGVVTTVDQSSQMFWVRLRDLSQASRDEEATISMSEVAEDDWPLIISGALFEWNIGREVRDKQVRRVSDIRFRRYFTFSPETVKAAKKRADGLAALLSEVDDYPTEHATGQ